MIAPHLGLSLPVNNSLFLNQPVRDKITNDGKNNPTNYGTKDDIKDFLA
jgi:hypothetical protein